MMTRLKSFGGVLAVKWDGTVDCAPDVFDFLRDVDGGIDNNSVVIFRNEDGQYVEAEPGQWIVKRSRHHFDALTGKALLAELQGRS